MGGMGERREMPGKGARHFWQSFLALTEAQSHGEWGRKGEWEEWETRRRCP
jgi:hypothetical protein